MKDCYIEYYDGQGKPVFSKKKWVQFESYKAAEEYVQKLNIKLKKGRYKLETISGW